MTDVMKPEGATIFEVYSFSGLWQYKCTGRELKTMSLKECFTTVFDTSFDRNMKQFFANNNFHFDMRRVTIDDIFRWIEQKTVIFPFSVTVEKQEVINYIDMGFTVMFMKPAEFKKMKKAYKDFC